METSYSHKPYFFVPLVDKVERRPMASRQTLLDKNTRAGILDVTIECVTPLHFGSGKMVCDSTHGRFYHPLHTENGKIALPGSSFKGMLRSVFEAVSASCVSLSPKALPLRVGELRPCNDKSGLCPVCSVFGRLSYKGKLTISSFYTDGTSTRLKIPALEQPFKTYPHPGRGDPHTGNARLYYGNFHNLHGLDVARMKKSDFFEKKEREPHSDGLFYGRKFYKHSNAWKQLSDNYGKDFYDCLPEKTTLKGQITYQGLTDHELGALLFALGYGWKKPIYHKLGYAKPAFFGSVKLTVSPQPLERYESEPLTADIMEKRTNEYMQAYEFVIGAAVSALQEEWSSIGNSTWPMDNGKCGY